MPQENNKKTKTATKTKTSLAVKITQAILAAIFVVSGLMLLVTFLKIILAAFSS